MTSIKISAFPGKDVKNFKNIAKNRKTVINMTAPSDIGNTSLDNLSKELKPARQRLVIKRIEKVSDDIKLFYFANADGKKLATFMPGQYITLVFHFSNNTFASRSYSLSSSPNEAQFNIYRIGIKRVKDGLISNYMLDYAKEGDIIDSIGPSGIFYPSTIRDKKHIVGIAYNTGISPLVSIAKAVFDKTLDKELTIFYVSDNPDEYMYRRELDEFAKNVNIKVVYLDKNKDELTVNLIKSYVTAKFTVFGAGDQEFYEQLTSMLEILNLGKKDFRYEMFSCIQKTEPPVVEEVLEIAEEPIVEIAEETEPTVEEEQTEEPKKRGRKKKEEVVEPEPEPEPVVEAAPEPEPEPEPAIYNVKVFTKKQEYNILCREDQTILSALETNNIPAKSKCKSGSCGYCRSLLLWGSIKFQDDRDMRKTADKKSNYIHPCCCYPVTDITIKLDI